jgi:hypothetical protein
LLADVLAQIWLMYLGLLVDRQFSIITLRNELLPVAIGSNGTRSSPFSIEDGVDRYPSPINLLFWIEDDYY